MPIKLINMGESGHGKTSMLAGLCSAGYNVRVLDLDNGIESLVDILTGPGSKHKPDAIGRLRWKTLTESYMSRGGNIVPRGAAVYPGAVAMLETWKGDESYDSKAQEPKPCVDSLGSIYSWTDKDVLVVDTLTSLAESAIYHSQMMQGALGNARTSMESMRDAGSAQGMTEKFLQFMRDDNLKCNIVINTHLNWAKEDGTAIEPGYQGVRYGFPSAIGKALNMKIGRNFNHILLTRKVGQEYRLFTKGVANIGLKSGAPLRVKESYGGPMALADYFRDVQAKILP